MNPPGYPYTSRTELPASSLKLPCRVRHQSERISAPTAARILQSRRNDDTFIWKMSNWGSYLPVPLLRVRARAGQGTLVTDTRPEAAGSGYVVDHSLSQGMTKRFEQPSDGPRLSKRRNLGSGP